MRARAWRRRQRAVPCFNFGTIAAFLAWFGGTGYLLSTYYSVWFVVALGDRDPERPGRRGDGVLVPGQGADARARQSLDPADYDMVGVLGQARASPIRAGGTGELIYSQEGTRRVAGARSEDGRADR